MALKASHLTDHLVVVQRPPNESSARKDLLIYDLKLKKKRFKAKNQINESPQKNYLLKKLI